VHTGPPGHSQRKYQGKRKAKGNGPEGQQQGWGLKNSKHDENDGNDNHKGNEEQRGNGHQGGGHGNQGDGHGNQGGGHGNHH
jgi:ribonuclease J